MVTLPQVFLIEHHSVHWLLRTLHIATHTCTVSHVPNVGDEKEECLCMHARLALSRVIVMALMPGV